MHVVIATGLYPPDIGGPATYAVFLERKLFEHGIPYTTLPFRNVRHLPKFVRHFVYLFRVLQAIRSDSIVLALDPVSVGLPAFLAARLRRTPFFLRVGGDYAWEQASQRGFAGTPEEFRTKRATLPRSIRRLVSIQSRVARGAKLVLVQSEYLASIVVGWDISRDKIRIIPNGISVPVLPSRETLRGEFGWGKGPVIVSAGRLVPWKGFERLIDAVAVLAKEFSGIQLMIAGSGPDDQKLRKHAADAKAAVRFLGSLESGKMVRLARAADVFALNTGYEGFSHQILEAMALGTPVVTTSIAGNKDLATNDVTALTVPFGDTRALAAAIRRIMTESDTAARLVIAARERASQFTPDRMFTETCKTLGISV